jgi:hypothetical protein
LELWLQNTQLIVGAKVAKNVVHPQATLFTQSASCRASKSLHVGALFSFPFVPFLRVLLSSSYNVLVI